MTGRYLLLGMIAGLIAGILAFGVGRIWGEPSVEAAIALEEAASAEDQAHDHAEGADHAHDAAPGTAETVTTQAGADLAGAEAEPAGHSHGDGADVSRVTQAGVGLLTGMALFGAGLGGLFALIFALVEDRFSRLGARGTAAVMALLGYVSVVLVPFLKYPANPPAVGHGETIGLRTQMYFTMLLLSLVAMAVAVAVARSGQQGGGQGRWRAGIAGGVAYVVLVMVAGYVLPVINEVPAGFPGDLLWQFRTIALVVQAVLWAAIGLIFGALAARIHDRPATLLRQPA